MLPGWAEVLNRETGVLEPCTPATCPYATMKKGANNTMRLVNKVSGEQELLRKRHIKIPSKFCYFTAASFLFCVGALFWNWRYA